MGEVSEQLKQRLAGLGRAEETELVVEAASDFETRLADSCDLPNMLIYLAEVGVHLDGLQEDAADPEQQQRLAEAQGPFTRRRLARSLLHRRARRAR